MNGLRALYLLNIILLAFVATPTLFKPLSAATSVFQNAIAPSKGLAIIGAFWMTILILSICGLFYPKKFELVFLVQLIYKSIWLLIVVVPAISNKEVYPKGVAVFFLIWVLLILFIFPFRDFFSGLFYRD